MGIFRLFGEMLKDIPRWFWIALAIITAILVDYHWIEIYQWLQNLAAELS